VRRDRSEAGSASADSEASVAIVAVHPRSAGRYGTTRGGRPAKAYHGPSSRLIRPGQNSARAAGPNQHDQHGLFTCLLHEHARADSHPGRNQQLRGSSEVDQGGRPGTHSRPLCILRRHCDAEAARSRIAQIHGPDQRERDAYCAHAQSTRLCCDLDRLDAWDSALEDRMRGGSRWGSAARARRLAH
jgi:hypothetical protein